MGTSTLPEYWRADPTGPRLLFLVVRGTPPSADSDPALSASLSAREPGTEEPTEGEEQEVRAEAAAPLSELVLVPSGLPMAWPSVRVAQEKTQAPNNGRRRQHPSS